MTTDDKTLRYDIVERNPETFVAELVARVMDGWAVSPTNPGDVLLSGTMTVSLYRDDDTVQAAKSKLSNVSEKPKMSRAETLAVAREAKAAKGVAPAKLDVETVQ